MSKSRFRLSLALVAIAVALPSAAVAASGPSTRLVTCRSGSCLLISGERDHAASVVSINGHAVAVEGRRKWWKRCAHGPIRSRVRSAWPLSIPEPAMKAPRRRTCQSDCWVIPMTLPFWWSG
jgi:hypothetical protein